jgi:hypothetical protein
MVNSRGQAALMDSLFFLTIVAAITAMLFFYLTSYGGQMNEQLDSFYTKDFSADSLKVITYVNVLRDGTELQRHLDGDYCSGGKCPAPQFDYLLTLMKEDYSDNKKFSPETISAISLTLNSVLRPFDDSVDYAFYLLSESESEFLFLMLATHEGSRTWDDDEEKFYIDDVERIYYNCEPTNQDVLSKYITPYVGKVNQSKGKISFLDPDVTDSLGRPFIIGLDVWVSKDLPVIKELEPKTAPGGSDFNCSSIMKCDNDGCVSS